MISKSNQIMLSLAIAIVVTSLAWANSYTQSAQDARNTPTSTATVTPTPTPEPEETTKPADPFWAGALDIQQLDGGKCHFEVCQYLRITTSKTCSSITLFGATTKDSGKVIDYFEQNLKRLAKGKSRVVEFGTDPANSYENFVELQDATCWK